MLVAVPAISVDAQDDQNQYPATPGANLFGWVNMAHAQADTSSFKTTWTISNSNDGVAFDAVIKPSGSITIDWGDGSQDTYHTDIPSIDGSSALGLYHYYDMPGEYTVSIWGGSGKHQL